MFGMINNNQGTPIIRTMATRRFDVRERMGLPTESAGLSIPARLGLLAAGTALGFAAYNGVKDIGTDADPAINRVEQEHIHTIDGARENYEAWKEGHMSQDTIVVIEPAEQP
jgi:hypothetical protein